MTVQQWLITTTKKFTQAGVETPRLDALVLLSDVSGLTKSSLLAQPERALIPNEQKILDKNVAQRCRHVPLAYIRGHTEFYGRDFIVNKHVLVPRPESESIIELLKTIVSSNPINAVTDMGTGSGCLAVTASLELPNLTIYASDVDKNALQVAESNANQLGAVVTFLSGDLLDTSPRLPLHKNTVIMANLPYVPLGYPVNQAASHEPETALYGGNGGMRLYLKMFEQLSSISDPSNRPGYLICESLREQHAAMTTLAAANAYHLYVYDGLAQVFRLEQNKE